MVLGNNKFIMALSYFYNFLCPFYYSVKNYIVEPIHLYCLKGHSILDRITDPLFIGLIHTHKKKKINKKIKKKIKKIPIIFTSVSL